MNMIIKYDEITYQHDTYDASYFWLEQNYGHHVPYMFPDLTAHLARCAESGTSEREFRRDASRMYNL